MTPAHHGALALALLFMVASTARARTITVTAEDCDRMAILAAHAPRLGWAGFQPSGPGVFTANGQLQFKNDMALLMRFPLTQIPKGQRVTKAELTVEPTYVAGTPEFHLRRLLADWGHGVCHLYRQTYPKKLEWAQPGGRGASTDRALKDTAVFHVKAVGAFTADVTEDVELWYTGAAPNHGWIMTLDNDGIAYFDSPNAPRSGGGKRWKLQITFEPQ